VKQPTAMELSLEELEAQAGESLPARALMSLFSTAGTMATPAMPDDVSNGSVDYTQFMKFDPFASRTV
jgi:hypothetical protein